MRDELRETRERMRDVRDRLFEIARTAPKSIAPQLEAVADLTAHEPIIADDAA
jgi:hypothetical protein